MSDKTNEQLEKEAREALVAADLTEKMKQWGAPPTRPRRTGSPWFRLLLLLFFGAAAWWFWPRPDPPLIPETPVEQPAPALEPAPEPQLQKAPPEPTPMAQKKPEKRYLALAKRSYKAPDFAAEIRGTAPNPSTNFLDQARQALAQKDPLAALDALKDAPPAYSTDADYLGAHALFALKQYTQAALLFGKLGQSVRYGEAAQWYEVLAMLPDYDKNKALILARLKILSADKGHLFQQEALGLLGQL